jgi:hypothetical protein
VFRRFAITAALVALAPITLIAQQTSLRPGTSLPVRIDQPISGQTVLAGAEILAPLAADLVQNGHAILPAGTPVVLRISEVSHPIPCPTSRFVQLQSSFRLGMASSAFRSLPPSPCGPARLSS